MRQLFTYFFLTAAIACTVMSGVLSGMASQRWGTPEQAQQLAERLASTPKTFGDWSLVREVELSPKVQSMLQCHGNVNRVYRNERTGDSVSVAAIIGPSGPTAVHKPEICYSSRNYEILKPESPIAMDTGIGEQSLWFTEFQSKGLEKEILRTYHAWTFDGEWDATREPRLAFMWKPYLFKIQVAAVVRDGETTDNDAGIRFLKDFIPQLNDRLFSEPAVDPSTTP